MKRILFLLLTFVYVTSLNAQNYKYELVRVENGHKAIDLGLSVLWAPTNLGANSPGEFGECYAWGEIEPKELCTDDNSVWYKKKAQDISGTINDAARLQWGGKWRVPTYDECKELVDKCTWKWVECDGSVGYQAIGPNGNWIFFPATGHWYGEFRVGEDGFGRYWSSTPSRDKTEAYNILIINIPHVGMETFERSIGCSIRPVINK